MCARMRERERGWVEIMVYNSPAGWTVERFRAISVSFRLLVSVSSAISFSSPPPFPPWPFIVYRVNKNISTGRPRVLHWPKKLISRSRTDSRRAKRCVTISLVGCDNRTILSKGFRDRAAITRYFINIDAARRDIMGLRIKLQIITFPILRAYQNTINRTRSGQMALQNTHVSRNLWNAIKRYSRKHLKTREKAGDTKGGRGGGGGGGGGGYGEYREYLMKHLMKIDRDMRGARSLLAATRPLRADCDAATISHVYRKINSNLLRIRRDLPGNSLGARLSPLPPSAAKFFNSPMIGDDRQ